jgi:hypothetical protein
VCVTLDAKHLECLESHHQGRLATVGGNEEPRNKPVGYLYNCELGTIEQDNVVVFQIALLF